MLNNNNKFSKINTHHGTSKHSKSHSEHLLRPIFTIRKGKDNVYNILVYTLFYPHASAQNIRCEKTGLPMFFIWGSKFIDYDPLYISKNQTNWTVQPGTT